MEITTAMEIFKGQYCISSPKAEKREHLGPPENNLIIVGIFCLEDNFQGFFCISLF